MTVNIRIKAWALEVEMATTDSYPDAVDDLVNRCVVAFKESCAVMQTTNIPLFDPELPDIDEE